MLYTKIYLYISLYKQKIKKIFKKSYLEQNKCYDGGNKGKEVFKMDDISKRLMIRFKKSKDFYKTIEKLKKEGFIVYHSSKEDKGAVINGTQTNEKLIMVGKDTKNCLISIYYEDNNDIYSEYKQLIHSIYY